MQKITPFLWFQKQGKEALTLYTSLFPDSKITSESTLSDTPSGTVQMFSFQLAGQDFSALSAVSDFPINPSISLFVSCETKEEVDSLWKALSPGGKVLMDLAEWPFAQKYGWVEDQYGVSWQLMYMEHRPIMQKITPTLLFTGSNAGKAEAAINLYTSLFKNTKADVLIRYEEGDSQVDPVGTLKHAIFTLENQKFGAMDSAHNHAFNFNEGISFMVKCVDQAEIDYFWEKLTADGGSAGQCGWLKDKYGVSWQIVPSAMDTMMSTATPEQAQRVTAAFMQMQKFDIAELEKAFEGK